MSDLSRRGKPWLDEELQQLLQEVQKKETIEQIAVKHCRTEGGIRSRLCQVAADYYFNNSLPVEKIMKYTGLNKEMTVDAISKRQYQMDLQEKKAKDQTKITGFVQKFPEQVKKEPPREDMVSLLKEVRDMMKEMLEILKKD